MATDQYLIEVVLNNPTYEELVRGEVRARVAIDVSERS
jgi:hypothetical protein